MATMVGRQGSVAVRGRTFPISLYSMTIERSLGPFWTDMTPFGPDAIAAEIKVTVEAADLLFLEWVARRPIEVLLGGLYFAAHVTGVAGSYWGSIASAKLMSCGPAVALPAVRVEVTLDHGLDGIGDAMAAAEERWPGWTTARWIAGADLESRLRDLGVLEGGTMFGWPVTLSIVPTFAGRVVLEVE